VWEEQVELVPILEEEEEGMYRVVEDLTQVEEEEAVTPLRMPPTHCIRRG
jgi:hypothetical protein